MKTLLVGINSKYIHPNLAIRYLKANCEYPVTIKEFNIKDSIEYIYNNIIIEKPDIVGFSVYIWNVIIINELINTIRTQNKDIIVILGGPEVSYDDSYLTNKLADYIIVNEGEIAFNLLIKHLHGKHKIEEINNLHYLSDQTIIKNGNSEISELDNLRTPYFLFKDDYKNKIAYVELSRGCPFNCSYCMASLEERVRFFNIDRVKDNLKKLYLEGSRTFKFLDRAFNIKENLAISLLDYIISEDFVDAVFQFEINADILSYNFLDYLLNNCPPNKIRFEIGIQSTNPKVNAAVKRVQNTDKLFENIRTLKKSNVIMHLDLIAGLPYETLESFKNTFNETFKLYGDELQLGFLKMLKGTNLFIEQEKYEYDINKLAPYELIENKYISKSELETIHIVEETLNIYWNKGFMNNSMYYLTKSIESPFDFLLELGKSFLNRCKEFHRYQLEDIFITLENYIDNEEAKSYIRYDYLMHSKIKPKIYWNNKVNKNEVIRMFHSLNLDLNIDNLYKYSVVTRYLDSYLIVLYYPNERQIYKIKA